MSDTYYDDPMNDPWFQGQPTQQDIWANEYGQGMGYGDFDDPLDEIKWKQQQLDHYLKTTRQYLPDLIPGLPQEVEAPDTSEPLFRSDFVDSYRNDEAYNKVNQLVQSGMGIEEAIAGVLQMSEDNGWAMPLELDQGDRLMNYDGAGNPVVQKTVAQYEAEQAYLAAGGEADKAGGPPRRRGGDSPDTTFPEFQAPRNINETLFAENSRKFVDEITQEQRSQSERDDAIAEYADYNAPRYNFDYEGMMERGMKGNKTDYTARARKPEQQYGLKPGSDHPSSPRTTPRNQGKNYDRDARAANRTNEANRASNERSNAAYRDALSQRAQREALPSKNQQRGSMMDEFLQMFYSGGNR
jgi:hypothetical protein